MNNFKQQYVHVWEINKKLPSDSDLSLRANDKYVST
jgi:hypothetical protein